MVPDFGDFIDLFAEIELDQSNLPLAALRESTSAPLWNPRLGNPIHEWRQGYFRQLFFLSRLNFADDIWRGSEASTWATSFGPAIRGYLTELFAGRFVDRNGTSVKFDLGIDPTDLTKLADINISQVAGSIVAALVEFLGDQAFQVPYYAPSILQANRDFRLAAKTRRDTRSALEKLVAIIGGGALSELDAKELGIPDFGNFTWGAVGSSPLVKSDLARMLMRRAGELDGDLLTSGRHEVELASVLDLINHGTSKLQLAFTCHKCDVIRDHLACHFVSDDTPGQQGECGADKDTGNLEGMKTDHSDLLGKLIAFGATAAEKSVRSLMGGIIRGISILSLDNEVIAEVVSAAASTLTKKVVENVIHKWLTGFIEDETIDPGEKRDVLARFAAIHNYISPEDR